MVKREVKKEGSIALALLFVLGPLVLGALLAFGVWSLTGRLVGGSFIHYLWRLPLCAYAFGAPAGTVAQVIFGQRGDVFHRDSDESQRHPPAPEER